MFIFPPCPPRRDREWGLIGDPLHSPCFVSVLRGRVDAVLQTDAHVYVMEIELDGSAEEAMAQIREKCHATAYRATGLKAVAIGMNFSSAEKRMSESLVAGEKA